MEEFKLDNPPKDCISCLRYAKESNVLLVSSWDNSISLYDTDKIKLTSRHFNKSAVLSCDFVDSNIVCLGGLDCEVKLYDFQKRQERLLGRHSAAVSCVLYVDELKAVISSSWDKTVKIWSIESDEVDTPMHTLTQENKVYSMTLSSDLKLFLLCDNRQIVVYNLRDLSAPLCSKESLLKFSLRSIGILLDGNGFVVGSVEGRAGVEYITESEQCKPFSFRCHRKTDSFNNELIYPVNSISVHPIYGTFATGGADGSVCVWDAVAKKRLACFQNYSPGISCLTFNKDGTKLAIACSYTFEQGPSVVDTTQAILIRTVNQQDVLPKQG